MGFVRLNLLGRPEIVGRGGRVTELPRSCQPVVAFLATNWRRRLDRTDVADTLWPDHEGRRARRCLATALWRLRALPGLEALVPPGEGARLALNPRAAVLVDIVGFERRVEALLSSGPAPTPAALRRGLRGLALYRADPFTRIDADWALIERERLRLLLVEGLARVAAVAAARGDADTVIRVAGRLTRLEPLREDVHRLLMEAYLQRGARAKAIAQYEVCRAELAAALNVAPMDETRELHERLVATAGRSRPIPGQRLAVEAMSERVRRAQRLSARLAEELDAALKASADLSKNEHPV